MFLSFFVLDDFFRFSKKIGFLGILGPPSYGSGAIIRIGREMLCLPDAGCFLLCLQGGVEEERGHSFALDLD